MARPIVNRYGNPQQDIVGHSALKGLGHSAQGKDSNFNSPGNSPHNIAGLFAPKVLGNTAQGKDSGFLESAALGYSPQLSRPEGEPEGLQAPTETKPAVVPVREVTSQIRPTTLPAMIKEPIDTPAVFPTRLRRFQVHESTQVFSAYRNRKAFKLSSPELLCSNVEIN